MDLSSWNSGWDTSFSIDHDGNTIGTWCSITELVSYCSPIAFCRLDNDIITSCIVFKLPIA